MERICEGGARRLAGRGHLQNQYWDTDHRYHQWRPGGLGKYRCRPIRNSEPHSWLRSRQPQLHWRCQPLLHQCELLYVAYDLDFIAIRFAMRWIPGCCRSGSRGPSVLRQSAEKCGPQYHNWAETCKSGFLTDKEFP